VQERPDGWRQVQVDGHTSYVRSDYLAEEQQQVTADVDWAGVEAAGGSTYSSISSVPHPTPASHKASPKIATGPKVYICGNGRTEVYLLRRVQGIVVRRVDGNHARAARDAAHIIGASR
jgi:hypothetical protein